MDTGFDPQDYVFLTGPILMATSFNWFLLGMLVLQVYIFYVSFPNERIATKTLVYMFLLLDLLQTAFSSHYAWHILISSWGSPSHIAQLPWTASTVSVITGIISAITQIYFAWRIWVLMYRSRLAMCISSFIILVALMQSISAIIGGIRFGISKADVPNIPGLTTGVGMWLVGSFVCDILIAGTMITILARARHRCHWKRTEALLTKLIINTIETGAITAITAGMGLTLFLLFPEHLLYEIPGFMLGKLYSNVVLAVLNSRLRREPWGSSTWHIWTDETGETCELPTQNNSQPQGAAVVNLIIESTTIDGFPMLNSAA